MPDPFTREERNQTVWQRTARVLNQAMNEYPGNFERITRAMHAHVLREREDARRGNADPS